MRIGSSLKNLKKRSASLITVRRGKRVFVIPINGEKKKYKARQ